MPGPASRGGCHTAEMADEDACFSCSNNERTDLPPRERIYIGPGWRVAHAFGTALPGWLVLLPRRHVTALDELTAAEAEELGPLLRAVTRTRVFNLLGADSDRSVADAAMDKIALRIAAALTMRRETAGDPGA
jgi:hypothetical protein